MQSDLERRLQLAPMWRFRCFGRQILSGEPCREPATHESPDVARGDAITFWCGRHKPDDATPIEPNRAYLAIDVAATLTLGASTVRQADAKLRAIALLDRQLRELGVSFSPIATSYGLMAPKIPIIGDTNRSDG